VWRDAYDRPPSPPRTTSTPYTANGWSRRAGQSLQTEVSPLLPAPRWGSPPPASPAKRPRGPTRPERGRRRRRNVRGEFAFCCGTRIVRPHLTTPRRGRGLPRVRTTVSCARTRITLSRRRRRGQKYVARRHLIFSSPRRKNNENRIYVFESCCHLWPEESLSSK